MIPAALASQLELGLADFLRMSFWSSTPGMETVVERLIQTPGALFKGPYVSVKLPFEKGSKGEFFPKVPLGFPAHKHQEQAFQRLSGATPKSTLVATGTGSGKTESFLWPILDYCRQKIGTPGIKAILVYPMNALATDQAARIAKAIHGCPNLRGGVRAGLYIGESPGERRKTHKSMGPQHLITDRTRMKLDPPDILLTNYKMLDYLLVRPGDQALWQHNHGDPLRFLVVDELHTFDGAQGTDLACLIRRLKARLKVESGSVCCVGTSATLGGGDAVDELRTYAQDIFGESFDADAVVGEQRVGTGTFFGEHLLQFHESPAEQVAALDPNRYPSPADYVLAQQALWFGEALDAPAGTDAWRVALGEQLMGHSMVRNVVQLLSKKLRELPELVGEVARLSRDLRKAPEAARLVVVSLLSLISEARTWLPERDDARQEREAKGLPPRTRPFLEVRLQVWQRELRRMVASVAPEPQLRFSDDLTRQQREQHLPLLHCRDCGAMGWATLQDRDKPDLYRTSLDKFYRAFFSNDPQVQFLWPAAAAPKAGAWQGALRFPLERESLRRDRSGECHAEEVVQVVVSDNVTTIKGKQQLKRDCPFCAARASLTLVGFRAATLTSVFIDQLFASTYNDDKKLLTFSDSVQDAAHRAGFFGARTWRFNVRVALQAVLQAAGEVSLEALPDAFVEHWRTSGRLTDAHYVSTFLAPSMEWFRDYELMRETGEVPSQGRLLRDVDRRLAYEVFQEFGHQARIGRSLPRTSSASTRVDPIRLQAARDALLEPLRNEVGGLRQLDATTLHLFLLGALHHLRERGGILHRELPEDFVRSGGRDTHVFNRRQHLPSYGRTSRLPALLTNDARSPRFDNIEHRTGQGSWYERWVKACFGGVAPLLGPATDVWSLVLPALVEHDLLHQEDGKSGRAWGLRPAALTVTGDVTRVRCGTCSHWQVVARTELPHWSQMPCLTARCAGCYVEDPETADYFGRMYQQGQVERVFTAEHTGLLTRGVREAVELEFKAEPKDRKPWFPNLLSCTPTLEMGIDIGALSSAILCSVPPGQANYLQRIGRAGRRDGNSLLLTIVQARPHDLYFYARPEEMLDGEVAPPGVFLNASAVLERQLAAYCLDRWNAEGVPPDAIPSRLSKVFDHLDDKGTGRFPRNWLARVEASEEELLSGFFALFEDRITDSSRDHLRRFLCGDTDDEGSLGWKVLVALEKERKQRDSLKRQLKELSNQLGQLTRTKAKNKDHDDTEREYQREVSALRQLIKNIDKIHVLQFLTDQGLLPNYAFPEAPIRLRSVIWRRQQAGTGTGWKSKSKKSSYETKTYEYTRPAMAAISELAPENRFFAGGRHVTINQVDIGTSSIETWRFCDQCAYSANIDTEDNDKDCPQCKSPTWGEDSQKSQLLRLEQVFANTSDRDSRIRDDQEERQPRHYSRHMLMSVKDGDRDGAWHIDDGAVPFGFEYFKRARFSEINFGEHSDQGTKTTIAGREAVRRGFIICKHCGKVQPKPPKTAKGPPPKPEHTLWCKPGKSATSAEDFETAIYLYREFSSEALRMLLPLSEVGTERELNSFMAAFQLGLRDKYGGKVDHLRTLIYNEPDEGGHLRRQYLALYDTVPGGTGYLKDFTRPTGEPDALHPLFEILQRALDRLNTCACQQDPDLDGCYSCLFAYRNSRDQSETSRQTATELLGRILAQQAKLKPIARLSDVSVDGLMDSVLEARFIEALRRLGTPKQPTSVTKALVLHKPGYRLTVGDQEWLVEPQRTLGPADGIKPKVSIDFVLHPVGGEAETRQVAVFLDGFQFHQQRISLDFLQRMTLLSSGRYDVWSFTWHDVDAIFHTDAKTPSVLLHEQPDMLEETLTKLKRRDCVEWLERPVLHALRDSLHGVAHDDWATAAATILYAQLKPLTATQIVEWQAEVKEHAPSEATVWFDDVDTTCFFVHRPPTVEQPFGLWASVPRSGLTPTIDPSAFRVLAWIDDRPSRRETAEFRGHWHGFLHLFQFLRALPHIWFVGTEQADLEYQALSLARQPPEELNTDAWSTLDVEPELDPILTELAAHPIALPQVGLDLLDVKGHTIGVEAELIWEDLQVAVVESMEDADRPAAPGWQIFELDDLLEEVTPLITALTTHPGNS